MKHKKILKKILQIVGLIFVFLILHSVIFLTTPTKETVENFFMIHREITINDCDPYDTEIDDLDEYRCAYNLRRNTAVVFGKIINTDFPLFGFTPFGYFNYDLNLNEAGCALTSSCVSDPHYYVLVITRDEGPLIYNPVNGKFIGRYDDLMQEMGCEVQPYKKPFFPIQPPRNKLEMAMFQCNMEKTSSWLEGY